VLHVVHNPLSLLPLGPSVSNFLLWQPISWTYSLLQTLNDLFCEKPLLIFCYWIFVKSLIFLFYEDHLCDPQIQWLRTTSLQCLIVKSFVTFLLWHTLWALPFTVPDSLWWSVHVESWKDCWLRHSWTSHATLSEVFQSHQGLHWRECQELFYVSTTACWFKIWNFDIQPRFIMFKFAMVATLHLVMMCVPH
jgi:hypothetical protein